jgi:hypothetical protein
MRQFEMLSVVKIWVEERSWEKILSYRIQMGMSRGKQGKKKGSAAERNFGTTCIKLLIYVSKTTGLINTKIGLTKQIFSTKKKFNRRAAAMRKTTFFTF